MRCTAQPSGPRFGRGATALLAAAAVSLAALAPAALGAGKGPVAAIGGSAIGTTGGLFTAPRGVAVNNSTGSVYAVDSANRIQQFNAAGAFVRAWGVDVVSSGAGNANEMQAVTVNAGAGTFKLSFGAETTPDLGFNASAATVQSALNALPTISAGGGSVAVSGGPGSPGGPNPYLVNFRGGALAGADAEGLVAAAGATPLSGGSGTGANTASVATFAPGGGAGTSFEICEAAAQCKGGTASAAGGGMSAPQGIALNQSTGDVYVSDQSNRRVDVYDENGNFLRAFGQNVISAGPHNNGTGFEICSAADTCAAGTSAATGGAFATTFSGYLAVVPASAGNAGDVVVADPTNRRIQEFAASGAFVRAIGFDVVASGPSNEGTSFEICRATIDVCKAGTAGAGLGQFSNNQPTRVAVDSGGFVYTVESTGNSRVQKISPTGGSIAVFAPASLSGAPAPTDVAVDPVDDRVYVVKPCPQLTCSNVERRVLGFDSAGTSLGVDGVETAISAVAGLAVRHAGGDLVVSSSTGGQRLYLLNNPPPPVAAISPVTTFGGTTATLQGEANPTGLPAGYRFEYSPDGASWTSAPAAGADLGFSDNALHPVSQGVTGLTGSQLYHVRLRVDKRFLLGTATAATATSPETTFTTEPAKPAVTGTGASQIGTVAARLDGRVNPQNQAVTYFFEYGDQGSCGPNPCAVTPVSGLGPAAAPLAVGAAISGLQPGTTYYARLLATNATGTTAGRDATFRTRSAGCPNELLRTGPSASLPDCRAYELVTPDDTNGVPPVYRPRGGFETTTVAAAGGDVIFGLNGGALPGTEASGSDDLYDAVRGEGGWKAVLVSPTGAQSAVSNGNGVSEDHGFSFWQSSDLGTLAPQGQYLRRADGSFELLGDGALADDREARGRWISPGGEHAIFTSLLQLEPEAPAAVGPGASFTVLNITENEAVGAVYDRTPAGVEVVSLLPGDATPGPGTTTYYRGASADGSAVVFNVDGTMYVRRDGVTVPVVTTAAPGEVTFEGVSRTGDRVFFLEGGTNGGKLFSFAVATQQLTQVSAATDAQVVNVSADGSHAYFVSREQLDPPHGGLGANNLYVWDGATTRFVAVLGAADVNQGSPQISIPRGLLHWGVSIGVPQANNGAGPGGNGSRTTPDGTVLVFESRTNLTSYDSGGHVEIYRYDAAGQSLACVSCSQADEPAVSDARFQGIEGTGSPTFQLARIPNVTDDGGAVYFMSADPLVPEDTDGLQDVYEWKGGQVSLISFGHSSGGHEWLYGMTPDGSDVFFTSNDALVPQKHGASAAIYDARVGGGFAAPAAAAPCVGDSCQGLPTPPPATPSAGSASFAGGGDQKVRRCVKGKRKCKRAHRKRGHRRHSGAGRSAGTTGRAGR